MTKQLKVATRRELIEAVARRYHGGTPSEKQQLLDELVKVTGFHRKHAVRVLRARPASQPDQRQGLEPRARLYDEAVQRTLIMVWEASDRLCGKRREGSDPCAGGGHGAPRPFTTGCRSAASVTGDERGHHGSAAQSGA